MAGLGARPGAGTILLGRYELVEHRARGGMAEVYEAVDRQLQRRVAVKVFQGAGSGDRARFDAEVLLLARLDHPGLVQVFDAGEQDGDAFVVMELVDGPTLAGRLAADAPLPAEEVAAVGAELAEALAHVHGHGVVHRDVTPSNVLCGPDGRHRVADFGIARLVDTTRITAAATTIGTAAYMAPEQVMGSDVTAAADVYALGLVLLEALTGRPGFTGSAHEVVVARLARTPDTATGVPGAWRGLLGEMTARAAEDRPSATEVARRLRALVAHVGDRTGALAVAGLPAAVAPTVVHAVADGTAVMPLALRPATLDGPPGARPARRWWWVSAAVGLLGLVALAATLSGSDGDRAPATTVTRPAVVAPIETSTTLAPSTTTTTVAEDEEAPAEPGKDRPGKGKGRDRNAGDDGDDD